MNAEKRDNALTRMQAASHAFYRDAISIGNHPFIQFAGAVNEHINEKLECNFSGLKVLSAAEAS